MRIPIGPLLNFEDGLTPRIGSAFSARCSSISPMDFMLHPHLLSALSILKKHSICNYFPVSMGPMYSPVNTTVPNDSYPSQWVTPSTLCYARESEGTLYYVRIYMGPFVTNNPRRLDEELIIEGPIKR